MSAIPGISALGAKPAPTFDMNEDVTSPDYGKKLRAMAESGLNGPPTDQVNLSSSESQTR